MQIDAKLKQKANIDQCELANIANNGESVPCNQFAAVANNANNAFYDAMVKPSDNDESDNLHAIPRPTPEQASIMLYGDVGTFAKAAADGKGLDPIAAALSCIVWLGSEVSPRILLSVGDTMQPARIFGVHVGRSSRGGKGDSSQLLKRVIRQINKDYEGVLGLHHAGGLSTREGLANALHDGYEVGEKVFEPINDKRLFVIESEFANVMAQTKREGNTLSTALRDAFDYPCKIDPMTKTNRISSTNPHVGILGHITPYELASKLTKNEISNGVLNRFMLIYSERIENVPFPPPTPSDIVGLLSTRFAKVIAWAKGNYGAVDYAQYSDNVIAELNAEAKAYWLSVFDELSNPYGGELISAATDRRRVFALRIALLFAITDESTTVRIEHLMAGVEWARFSAKTAAHILSGGADIEIDTVDKTQLDRLKGFLTGKGFVSRTDISRDCFKGHLNKTKLNALLQLAIDSSLLERKNEQAKAGGVMVTLYKVKAK